ncbi:hypothetical protein MTO96_027926 [Rhipicephalus appendiculatus]
MATASRFSRPQADVKGERLPLWPASVRRATKRGHERRLTVRGNDPPRALGGALPRRASARPRATRHLSGHAIPDRGRRRNRSDGAPVSLTAPQPSCAPPPLRPRAVDPSSHPTRWLPCRVRLRRCQRCARVSRQSRIPVGRPRVEKRKRDRTRVS